jgi:HSP20 family protein
VNREPSQLQPWQPVESFTPLRDVMSRLLEESFVWPARLETSYSRAFPLDVYEDESSYIIEATLPGVKPDELQINATDTGLTIHAAVKREDRDTKKGAYLRRERFEGEMTRTVTLSAPIDPSKVSATYENGVLKLTAPKSEVGKPKQIQVQVR